MDHLEFVVELHSGARDWIDPVDEEAVTKTDTHLVVSAHGYEYTYSLEDVSKWTIRPYSASTTYDRISGDD